jgi:two-component system chemotaxis sensor kinase CheA
MADDRGMPVADPPSAPPAFALLPEDPDREMLSEYVIECRDLIEGAEASLLVLETEPEDAEALNTVFRAFHTIKGTSGFLGVVPIGELAHKAETLLARARDGEIRYGGYYADLALRSVDLLKELFASVEGALAGEVPVEPDGLQALIDELSDPSAQAERAAEEPEAELPQIRMGDILAAEGKVPPEVIALVARERGDQLLGQAMVRSGVASSRDVADALRKQQRLNKGSGTSVDAGVRVRTDRLDRLIEMVGELVIAHTMVEQDETLTSGGNLHLVRKTSHMGKIVRELQDLSMSMRMVPLRATFQKMARLVRDVSQKMGKDVHLVTEGEDTEIDRNMVDAIGDPLVHMIRNAIDHGVEAPDQRAAAGKPPRGTVRLSACHSGGNVVVTVADDGRGLDRRVIADLAIERGLIESDKGLSDSEVFGLIFEAGFSTAETVTDVSGRGVGMDVVRRNVESLRGRIEISAEKGHGSQFSLQLPLTLAITDGMLLRVAAERYIIPTSDIIVSVRPQRKDLASVAGKGLMVTFRNAQIPVFRLARLFGIEGAVEDPTEGLLVVISAREDRYALLVDDILGQHQIVAKTLGEGVGKVAGVSGGAILGDGRVGLILDAGELGALGRRRSGAAAQTTI